MDGHRTIGQHIARVHEQRTPIHAAPSSARRETLVDARRYQRAAAAVLDWRRSRATWTAAEVSSWRKVSSL